MRSLSKQERENTELYIKYEVNEMDVFMHLRKSTLQAVMYFLFELGKIENTSISRSQSIETHKPSRYHSVLRFFSFTVAYLHCHGVRLERRPGKGIFFLIQLVRDRKMKQKLLGQQELWDMFATLTSAVKYLHEQGILHRDIKLENIFITEDGKVKLGDLGMSKVLGKED